MEKRRWKDIKDYAAFSRSIQDLLKAFGNRDMVSILTVYPRVDMYDTGTHIVVEAEVPGFKKGELKAIFNRPYLYLDGKQQENSDSVKRPVPQQRRNFKRQVLIPATVDARQVETELANGILYMALPKIKEKQKPITIEIN
jgi:HSP20 family protein